MEIRLLRYRHNNYYNPQLKEDYRARYIDHASHTYIRFDLATFSFMEELFKVLQLNRAVNLAAQAWRLLLN